MNKWIPISLFIFLGLYLLTTFDTVNVIPDEMRIAETQPDKPGNIEMPNKNRNDEHISMQ